MHKHRIILKNFDLENGTISFSKLRELQDKLTALAEGVVLNLIEGRSKPGPGKKPAWLREALDFNISGLRSGSTVLDIEASEIASCYHYKQFGVFDEPNAEQLMHESAFGLVSYAYKKAITEPESSGLLDKRVLKLITNFNKVLDNDQSEITLFSNGGSKIQSVSIKKETLNNVSITEQKTKDSVKTAVSGTLDVMRHEKEQMEIITSEKKRIRAFSGKNIDIKNLKDYFGEYVQITGMAHFKTDGGLKYIEILHIEKSPSAEHVAEELTLPIFENLDLKRLATEQDWHGFDEGKFKETIDEMEIEESPEELLALLKE